MVSDSVKYIIWEQLYTKLSAQNAYVGFFVQTNINVV